VSIRSRISTFFKILHFAEQDHIGLYEDCVSYVRLRRFNFVISFNVGSILSLHLRIIAVMYKCICT